MTCLLPVPQRWIFCTSGGLGCILPSGCVIELVDSPARAQGRMPLEIVILGQYRFRGGQRSARTGGVARQSASLTPTGDRGKHSPSRTCTRVS